VFFVERFSEDANPLANTVASKRKDSIMSNITITTAKGENLRSFIINEDGEHKVFATVFKDGSFYGLASFATDDEKVSYTKCSDGFIYAIRPATSRKTGKPFNWEIFIEA
jgi:hypothetical protein